jgi:hypothetical protein
MKLHCCLAFFLYLCRAGHKLEGAIEQLGVDVAGRVALDSGLSTGGFTDCLLQYGAAHVYGVDVGYGQVTCLTSHYFLGYFRGASTYLVRRCKGDLGKD